MTQIRSLYNTFAEYYDCLHSKKNYANEVAELKKIIRKYKKSNGDDLLDVACGTGQHISFFQKDFSCTGIDLHKSMLKVARKKNPSISFKQSEMENFHLRKRFDIITCLYGSVSYTLTVRNLKTTVDNFVHHLQPGGVVIIEPYFSNKQFKPNCPTLSTVEDKDLKIARVSLSRRKGKLATRNMIMTVVEKGKGVFSFEDKRDIALFAPKQILTVMKQAGLKAFRIKNAITPDFDLYVGVKE